MSNTPDPFVQTRTARGFVPCEEVLPMAAGKSCETRLAKVFRFMPLPPTKVVRTAASRTDAPVESERQGMALLRLAACISLVRTTLPQGAEVMAQGIDTAKMLAFAKDIGPLIARSPFAHKAGATETPGAEKTSLAADVPLEESIGLWTSAVLTANLAVTMQEFFAGTLPFPALPHKLPALVKQRVVNPWTQRAFSLVVVPLPISKEYARWLGAPAFVRREVCENCIDYSFLLCDEDTPDAPVDMLLASFSQEITASDYRLLAQACNLSEARNADVVARLGIDASAIAPAAFDAPAASDEFSAPTASDAEHSAFQLSADELLGEQLPFEEADLPRLRSLVHMLVAAHLRDAHVDVFTSNADTGYLAFDSALSWLWYDFSRGLDVARIRYCAHCGRAFPLVGHRGPDKLFCSLDCKNTARNERNSRRRTLVREQFREQGTSVVKLAARYFPEESPREGRRRVAEALSSWPTLKHDIDDEIAQLGWSSPLLARCRDEGLDLERLLPARRKAELRRAAQTGKSTAR